MAKEYSVGEVANKLKTPYFRVIRMIKRGELPGAYKVGWGWVIPESALDAQDEKGWKIPGQISWVDLESVEFEFKMSPFLKKLLNRKKK